MPETFEVTLSELASRASDVATLDEAALLRQRGERRTKRRRGQAVLGVAAVATAIGVSLAMPGASATPSRTATAGATSLAAASTPAPSAPTTPTASTTPDPLASAEAPHELQIQAQLTVVDHFQIGDSRYAVIATGSYHSTRVTFYASATSDKEVTDMGATWVQIIAATLERGFTHVTIKAEPDSAAPADTIIDVQTTTGQSVLGERIPFSTPIVLIAAV